MRRRDRRQRGAYRPPRPGRIPGAALRRSILEFLGRGGPGPCGRRGGPHHRRAGDRSHRRGHRRRGPRAAAEAHDGSAARFWVRQRPLLRGVPRRRAGPGQGARRDGVRRLLGRVGRLPPGARRRPRLRRGRRRRARRRRRRRGPRPLRAGQRDGAARGAAEPRQLRRRLVGLGDDVGDPGPAARRRAAAAVPRRTVPPRAAVAQRRVLREQFPRTAGAVPRNPPAARGRRRGRRCATGRGAAPGDVRGLFLLRSEQ